MIRTMTFAALALLTTTVLAACGRDPGPAPASTASEETTDQAAAALTAADSAAPAPASAGCEEVARTCSRQCLALHPLEQRACFAACAPDLGREEGLTCAPPVHPPAVHLAPARSCAEVRNHCERACTGRASSADGDCHASCSARYAGYSGLGC